MSDIVYDGKIYEHLSVDVSQPNMFAPPLVKEGDSGTRGFIITVTDNGEPIAIPTTATVWLNCSNTADAEKHASAAGTINSDGTVTVDVPTVVMEVPGLIECDVSIITLSGADETEILKSTLFCLSCERAANKDGTSTKAEDSILAGIASGEIEVPGASGPQGPAGPAGPQGPAGADGFSPSATVTKSGDTATITITDKNGTTTTTIKDGKGVRVITPEESQGWDDEIPLTFAGKLYDIAGWNDKLWVLNQIAAVPAGGTNYFWEPLISAYELDTGLEAKMALAPINPTAAQIAAMSAGQLYSDTVNHKGVVKGGQEFYDTTYIDENYRKTVVSDKYPQSINGFNAGDKWICCARSESRNRTFVFYKPQKYDGRWLPLNNYLETSFNPPPNFERFDNINYIYRRFKGDEYIHEGTQDFYKLINVQTSVYGTQYAQCDYTWLKIYSSAKIDSMIGDIETALSEV